MMIITGCAALYHKSFVDSYIERFKDAVESKLESAGEAHLRKAQFKTIEDTVHMVWLQLMRRKAPEANIKVGKYQLLTKLGLLFLR